MVHVWHCARHVQSLPSFNFCLGISVVSGYVSPSSSDALAFLHEDLSNDTLASDLGPLSVR